MKEILPAFLKTFGAMLLIFGALGLEKYLDTTEITEYSLFPWIMMFVGGMVFFSTRNLWD